MKIKNERDEMLAEIARAKAETLKFKTLIGQSLKTGIQDDGFLVGWDGKPLEREAEVIKAPNSQDLLPILIIDVDGTRKKCWIEFEGTVCPRCQATAWQGWDLETNPRFPYNRVVECKDCHVYLWMKRGKLWLDDGRMVDIYYEYTGKED